MKKLLLVLLVVTLASFLLVGCLGEGTVVDDDDDDDDGDVIVQAVTIAVAGEYYDAATGLTYVQGTSKLVTVTFAEAIAEEYGVQINGVSAAVTAGSDRKIWTLAVDFGATPYVECVEECIVVTVGHPCCPEEADTYWKLVVPDGIAPCASFTLTLEDCECEDPAGAEMSWITTCEDECDEPMDCCDDNCSGVGDWSFVLDDDVCDGPCDTDIGDDCAIIGAFECGCLSYADPDADPVLTGVHEVDVSIKDNVGNEFTDTWTLTFDTDELTSIVSDTLGTLTVTGDAVDGWEVIVSYDCTWDDCDTCFPEEG